LKKNDVLLIFSQIKIELIFCSTKTGKKFRFILNMKRIIIPESLTEIIRHKQKKSLALLHRKNENG